jgi:hypothetical protein
MRVVFKPALVFPNLVLPRAASIRLLSIEDSRIRSRRIRHAEVFQRIAAILMHQIVVPPEAHGVTARVYPVSRFEC